MPIGKADNGFLISLYIVMTCRKPVTGMLFFREIAAGFDDL